MVFSSNLFLFLFLPIVLGGYYVTPRRMRNAWLLAASLLFYSWGGVSLTLLICASAGMNYLLALAIERHRKRPLSGWLMGLATVLNLGPLFYFKYAAFFSETLGACLEPLGIAWSLDLRVTMPIGISFFTFQAFSYVIDVYRGEIAAARNPVDILLYIVFFPQLIAGPIVRYCDVGEQLRSRRETASLFVEGIERFIFGLAKKILIANAMAAAADQIFAIPSAQLTVATSWLGILCYTLQIYYDFSGYSDMAVGLGLMFGIRFLENFNYPYVARSVTEFWRRWHISLSVWFRDYVYIPLGGNRMGDGRTYLNLLIVFVLCGLWHGARWNFVVWGLYFGVFLTLERVLLTKRPARLPAALAHAYTLAVVVTGWVFFRADNLAHALHFFAAMFGFGAAESREFHLDLYWDVNLGIVIAAAVLGATPWLPAIRRRWAGERESEAAAVVDRRPSSGRIVYDAVGEIVFRLGRTAVLGGLLLTVAVVLSAATYNPFIYFRF